MLWIAILVALKPPQPAPPPPGIMICFIQKWSVFLFCVSIIETVWWLDLCCCKDNRVGRGQGWAGGVVMCVLLGWSYGQCETLKNQTWGFKRAVLSNPITVLNNSFITEEVRGKPSVEKNHSETIPNSNGANVTNAAKQTDEWLKKIEKFRLSGKFKAWLSKCGLLPRCLWFWVLCDRCEAHWEDLRKAGSYL